MRRPPGLCSLQGGSQSEGGDRCKGVTRCWRRGGGGRGLSTEVREGVVEGAGRALSVEGTFQEEEAPGQRPEAHDADTGAGTEQRASARGGSPEAWRQRAEL